MPKKIKVTVKKRKINTKKVLLFLLIIYIIFYIVIEIIDYPIKNIYIIGNNTISDYEIITSSGLSSYPSLIKTSTKKVEKKLLTNNYIKNVSIKKKFKSKLIIEIEERRLLCLTTNNKIITSDGVYLDNIYTIKDLPTLINEIPSDIFEKFYKNFDKVDDNILSKISQIEYTATQVDKERFLLYMNDGNYVYITLDKITKLNKYDEIYKELEGKKGILNLDSGNSFEIKEA